MPDPDFFDFMIEGGDELLNTKVCPHCGEVVYLDQNIEWIDKNHGTGRCSKCGGELNINK